jgi:hypothetical protein
MTFPRLYQQSSKRVLAPLLLLILVSAALLTSCGSDSSPTSTPAINGAPTITAGPNASPIAILDNATSTISAAATDPDGDSLTYAWSAANGTITGSGPSVSYSPNTVAAQVVHTISLTVSDGNGGSVTGFVNVTVSPSASENSSPQITSGPSASTTTIMDSETCVISVSATDPDGDTLTYAWSAANGTVTGSGTSVTYNPNQVSANTTHSITVFVRDDEGASTTGTASVAVTRTPIGATYRIRIDALNWAELDCDDDDTIEAYWTISANDPAAAHRSSSNEINVAQGTKTIIASEWGLANVYNNLTGAITIGGAVTDADDFSADDRIGTWSLSYNANNIVARSYSVSGSLTGAGGSSAGCQVFLEFTIEKVDNLYPN